MRDLTGRRFGRLAVLFPTERRDRKGSVYWRCRCDCGREVEVTEDGLVHGSYKSCGCLQEEVRSNLPNQLHRIDGTCVEWLRKRKYRSDNTSGFRGVSEMKNGRYRVTIGFKRQKFHIGTYTDFGEAVEARLEVERLIHDGFVAAYDRWAKEGDREAPLVYEVEKRNGKLYVNTDGAS